MVDDLHSKLESARTATARREKLIKQLEARSLTQKQKKVCARKLVHIPILRGREGVVVGCEFVGARACTLGISAAFGGLR